MLVHRCVACCNRMHWRIYHSEFREFKVTCVSIGRMVTFACCFGKKSTEFLIGKEERICSRCIGVKVEDISSGKIASE